jgi:hypothetical protein
MCPYINTTAINEQRRPCGSAESTSKREITHNGFTKYRKKKKKRVNKYNSRRKRKEVKKRKEIKNK